MNQSKLQIEIKKSTEGLLKYIDDMESFEFSRLFEHVLNEAANDLDVTAKDVIEILVENNVMQYMQNFIFEIFATGSFEEGNKNIVNQYLRAYGWSLSPVGVEFLENLASSKIKLWEVCGVNPGSWVKIRELGTSEEIFKVSEKSGSKYLTKWSVVAASTVLINDTYVFTGGILNYSRKVTLEMIDYFIKESDPNSGSIPEAHLPVLYAIFWIVDLYHQHLNSLTPTKFVNSEGHNLEFVKIRYPIANGYKDEISSILSESIVFLDADEKDSWIWLEEGVQNINSRVLGSLELFDGHLNANVNSDEHGQVITKLLNHLLGNRIGKHMAVHEDVNVKLKQHSSPVQADQTAQIKEQLGEAAFEDLIAKSLDAQYRQTLNNPVPMLQDMTPFECAKNEEYHAMLVNWLKYLENQTASNPQLSNYSFEWMWKELGLSYPG